MNTALKIYISNENLAESLNYFSTCTLLLLIITIEGMLYFGKRRNKNGTCSYYFNMQFWTQALIKDHQWRHLLSTMQLHHHPGENQVFLRDGVYYKLVLYHNCFFTNIYSVFTNCLFYSQEYICNIEYPDDRDKF